MAENGSKMEITMVEIEVMVIHRIQQNCRNGCFKLAKAKTQFLRIFFIVLRKTVEAERSAWSHRIDPE